LLFNQSTFEANSLAICSLWEDRVAWHQPFNKDEIKKGDLFLENCCTSLAYPVTSLSPLPLGKSQFSVGLNASHKPYNQYWILDSRATNHTILHLFTLF